MIYVDSRAGSKDLVKPLATLLGANLVEETDLTFGDLYFAGRGIGGHSVAIGVEHKRLGDIIQCCRDGRFAGHQLPGLRKTYDHAWLLIEGAWRADAQGFVATYKGPQQGWKAVPSKMRASEYEKHLLTFQVCGGVHVAQVDVRESTLRFLVNLYRWWSDVDLDKHTSHLAIHQPAMLGEVSAFRRAVMAWPSIGLKTSTAVEQHFDSIMDAATAETSEWEKVMVDGRRLGTKTAERIVRFLTKRGE
jgi:ERCC4-type nuclease